MIIPVYQHIPECDNPGVIVDSPGGLWVVLGDPVRRLTDNLKMPLHSRPQHRIGGVIVQSFTFGEVEDKK